MLSDELYNLVHIERRKFFYTAWELTVRPASSIKMVLNGYKKYLYPYFNYLILLGTITIFLSLRYKFFVTGFELIDQNTYLNKVLNAMGFNKAYSQSFFNYAEEFATIVNIVAVPVFSLISFFMFYKNKYNMAEHFILNVYISAQQLLFLWCTIPILEFFPISKDSIIATYTSLTIVYNIWVYSIFFEGKWLVNIFKSTVAVILAFIIQIPVNYSVYYVFKPFIKWLDALF